MVKKSFRVTVCIDIHQVTCPGVWLCPKGKIFITLSLFKCLETTKQVRPIFPLKYHQRFVFDKVFDSITSLGELEKEMESRSIKMELVQIFKGKLKMVTLGIFQAPLTSVLYPSVSNGSESGAAEVDLLFESCKPFPGIISPKAEVSTRAVIEELRLCTKFTDGPVNPILVPSAKKCGRARSRQRAVCHIRQSDGCTCCVVRSTSKKRPKTTGAKLSPNRASSSRCKGNPPRRSKSKEEGDDESDQLRFAAELQSDSNCDSNSPRSKTDNEVEQGNEDVSLKSIGNDDRRNSSFAPKIRRQAVQADVHPRPPGYDDNSDETRKTVRSNSIKSDRNSKPVIDQGKISHLNSVDIKNLTRRSDNDETLYKYLNNGDQQDGANKQVCDCYTCSQCKNTIGKFMIPWKVYAAPPAIEHCFCHSISENMRNGNRVSNYLSEEVKNLHNSSDNQRQVYGRKNIQTATTQTTAICNCIEENEWSAKNDQQSYNTSYTVNRVENGNTMPARLADKIQSETKESTNQKSSNPDCETLTVKFLCPNGCCIDLSGKKPTESTVKKGSVQQRTNKTANNASKDKTSNSTKKEKETNVNGQETRNTGKLSRNVPLNKHLVDQNKCFCPKNKIN